MQNNVPEKRLFNLVVLVIDYYQPIQLFILTKSIFFWLDRLSLLVGLPTNSNRIESENHTDNCNMSKEDNEVFWIEEILPINSNCIKSKNHGNIYSKNHCDISDGVSIQELLLDNLKSHIDNYDISSVGDEVIWIKEIPSTDPNCIKSKSHDNNCVNNCNSNRIDGKEQGSDNLEGPK